MQTPSTSTAIMKLVYVIYIVTSVHHIYGGMLYNTPERLFAPVLFGGVLLATIFLNNQQRLRKVWAARLFTSTLVVFWVGVIGLFEGGYNHVFKTVLFLASPSNAVMERFFPAFEYVWPNDVFFEGTGILTFIIGLWLLVVVVRTRTRTVV